VTTKPIGDNLLTHDRLATVLAIMNEAQSNCTVTYNGRNYTYDDLCATTCDVNDPLRLFYVSGCISYINFINNCQLGYTAAEREGASKIELGYPKAHVLGIDVELGNNLYGVKTTNEND
jgi:hypothetical protein